MHNPLTFATEAERLAAREQFVRLADAIWNTPTFAMWVFDRTFPPIVPPKMVPTDGWLWVDFNGTPVSRVYEAKEAALAVSHTFNEYRLTRVLVTEVEA